MTVTSSQLPRIFLVALLFQWEFMMKQISFMLFLLAGIFAGTGFAKERITYPNGYQAKILSIYDGDTFTAEIYSWLQISVQARVRIRRIDTAEIRGKCDAEKQQAQKAKARLQELLPLNSIVTLNHVELGTYAGRIIADVSTDAVQDIGTQMIADKLARPYNVREGRQSWC